MNNIDHPEHYTNGGIETIDYIRAKTEKDGGFIGYLRGNAIKYLSRAGKKNNTIEDLKKAKWMIDKMITELEPDEDVRRKYENTIDKSKT
jgi:hypothetical protein